MYNRLGPSDATENEHHRMAVCLDLYCGMFPVACCQLQICMAL